MRLPEPVRREAEAAIEAHTGRHDPITSIGAVGGGCISPTTRVQTASGDVYFLKQGASGLPAGMLTAEANGLRALAAAHAVRVPAVIGAGGEGASAWLVLEWLEPGSARPGSWEALGRDLAALHQHRAHRFGHDDDNFIGSLPQSNRPADDWPGFWRDRRLSPQLRLAAEQGLLEPEDAQRFETLFHRLDELLAPAHEDGPSLLHGDLWSGNVHILHDGTPAIVDPSVYHGHREVDLAMADLFGGFPAPFHHAYRGAWPLAPGYEPTRRAIYQLYYLLVHVNLFGAGYLSRTRATLGDAGV